MFVLNRKKEEGGQDMCAQAACTPMLTLSHAAWSGFQCLVGLGMGWGVFSKILSKANSVLETRPLGNNSLWIWDGLSLPSHCLVFKHTPGPLAQVLSSVIK